jgi:hypothetical protein
MKSTSKRDPLLSYKILFKSEDKIAVNNGELIPVGTTINYYGDPIMDNSVCSQRMTAMVSLIL